MTDYPERNLLANALSPYLLQHAENPVHWREWGSAALAEAQATGKPILLSVGYAACHWCHVMAHESFENTEIAALMNARYVNIKVDREERPDIDQIYMSALQAMGEQRGWPLTMFLTPAGRPFWGGTYFPVEARYGRPGFADVLKAVDHLFHSEPEKVARNAEAVSRHIAGASPPAIGTQAPERRDIDRIAERLLNACDTVNGGIGTTPKFPTATIWDCLWRAWVRGRDPRLRDAALHWLRALCRGGIYDHLAGGLHRYTVDERWLVPHFEKMLYDNAQFIRALVIGHGATGEEMFRTRIEETVGFLLTEMRSPEGGFISSYDADSEGEEGRYYVWTAEEVDHLLGADAEFFRSVYDVTESGNWEGRNILNLLKAPADCDIELLSQCRRRLLAARKQRTPPQADDKVLVDWNTLAIRALAEAGTALDRPEWIVEAETVFDFVSESIGRDGRLAHAYRAGRTAYPALATDLAGMVQAAIALYAATGKDRFIARARGYAADLHIWHGDGAGNFTLAAKDQEAVPMRMPVDRDEAVPSATAWVVEALQLLATATGDIEAGEQAQSALAAAWARVAADPFGSIGLVNAADTVLRAPKLLTTGDPAVFSSVIRADPDPARFQMHVEEEAVSRLLGDAVPARSEAAYLCHGPICLAPVSDGESLERLLATPERT